jgi:hypothetical protein
LDIDDGVGLVQLVLQPLVLALQPRVLLGKWVLLRLAPPLLGRQTREFALSRARR